MQFGDRAVTDLHALYDRHLTDPATRRGYNRLVSIWRTILMPVVSAWCMLRLDVGERLVRRAAKRRPPSLISELRRWNPPGDIVPIDSLLRLRVEGTLPEDGLFLGAGWHSVEHSGVQAFRWLESDGQIVITRPSRRSREIVLFLEPGPGQNYEAFELGLVDASGIAIARVTLAERCEIALTLPLGEAEVTRFRLTAPKGTSIATDPRIMNLRVFRIAWDASEDAVPAAAHA